MKECPFCREMIQRGAIKCRYCLTMLVLTADRPASKEASEDSRITYIVDKGLVNYIKVAAGVLALLVGTAAYFFGLDLRKGRAEMDDQVKRARDSVDDAAKKLADAEPLVDKIKKSEREASLALKGVRSAETKVDARITEVLRSGAVISEERTRRIFEELMVATVPRLSDRQEPDAVRKAVQEAAAVSANEGGAEARKRIEDDIQFATEFFNQLLDLDLEPPGLTVLPSAMKNAYWDGRRVNAPLQLQYIPDAVYHETAHLFIEAMANLKFEGQSGSLNESFADVLATLAVQGRLKQSEQTADWVLMRKGVAWIRGEDLATTTRNEPLRSLKNPGEAYNDPVLGKDPQVAHMRDFYSRDDRIDVRINAGIPNKAFYEAANLIGAVKAGQIWIQALRMLGPQSKFLEAAQATRTVASQAFGKVEEEAVMTAWGKVGIALPQ